MSIFSQTLKKYRLKKKLSQKDIADTLGLHKQNVSEWERGRAKPRAENVKLLCKTLGLPLKTYVDCLVQDFTKKCMRQIKIKK